MISQELLDIMNISSQLFVFKYIMQFKICFDLFYYFSVFFMFVGVGFIFVVGLSIFEEISECYIDIQYLFNVKMLFVGEMDFIVSEVILVYGVLKFNNILGYVVWFIVNIEIVFVGFIILLGLYNLCKLFVNLFNY